MTVEFEATEKLYGDYQLLATNPGGHSSLPRPDNAIYHVVDALAVLQKSASSRSNSTPSRANISTQMARSSPAQTAADMRAILQTPPDAEAIARLSQGSALQLDHAHDLRRHHARRRPCLQRSAAARRGQRQLPHLSRAFARGYPARSREAVRRSDSSRCATGRDSGQLSDHGSDRKAMTPPPLNPMFMHALTSVSQKIGRGCRCCRSWRPGASDSIYTMMAGIPSYGVNGVRSTATTCACTARTSA